MQIKRDASCSLCRLSQTTSHVCLIGTGPSRCDVMVIGEAPGRNEEAKGRPFVGEAGQLIRSMLDDAGIDERDVFFTNAVLCRPPDNRTPTKGEIKACSAWLTAQIKAVRPKFVLLLGNVPLQSITGSSGIKKARGRPIERDGIVYLPTYHPAFILRDPGHEGALRADVRLFADIIREGGIPREHDLNLVVVDDDDTLAEMYAALDGSVSFDIETTCLYPWDKDAAVTSIGFGTRNAQYCVPFTHRDSPWSDEQIDLIVETIDRILEERGVLLIAHNGKFDFLWMLVRYGVKWYAHFAFDTMLAHYALDENSPHGLKLLARVMLGAPDWDIDKEKKQGSTDYAQLAIYHAHDLFYTRQLRYTLGKRLREEGDVKRVFDKILMPCARLFVEVEFDGIYLDLSKFDEAEKYLRDELAKAEAELQQYGDINWGSPKQLAELLFDQLGLDIIEVTKTGAASTSESVIKRLDHPCAQALLKFRAAKQQLSFFIDGWKPFIHKGVLHPSFKIHGTVTGRFSCEHPNLQQVPRDKRIRSLITAPPGWVFVEADLSQIELRIAAELANEPAMLHAFDTGLDVHWLTLLREFARSGARSEVVLDTARTWKQDKKLGYAESIEVLLEMGPDAAAEIRPEWKELRKQAKAINFGYLYGMWWKKFKDYARDNYDVIVTDAEAKASRESFFQMYRFDDWHQRQRRYARRHGYVRSLSGRKRRLPGAMRGDDSPERREAERQAINSPVQSFANELNLMTMIQLREEFPRDVMRLLGAVHDATLMMVRREHVERVARRVLEIMRHPDLLDVFDIELRVPLDAEVKIGPWGSGIDLEKWLRQP